MLKPTDGWVTFQRIRMPDGRTVALVQKRDGSTRTILTTSGAAWLVSAR